VEILLWLVPPVVVTALAMCWVAWQGRERAEVDPEVAVRRMGRALERERPRIKGYAAPTAPPDRSTGVAVRRSQTRRAS
jgi:hypothetical protein